MKVIHLIPQDGLGGVEQAARSLNPSSELDIHIAFIRGSSLRKDSIFKEISGPKVNLNSLMFYINGLKYLVKEKPDLLISSLWRSSIIGIAYNIYSRAFTKNDSKFVLFLHVNKFGHIFDQIFTTIAMYLADEVWCDSKATQLAMLKKEKLAKKSKVISFLVHARAEEVIEEKRKNNFVFWGRIAKQKRVDKAIKLFSIISRNNPSSLFYIYGPDGGELNNLKTLVKELELEKKVLFMGKKEPGHYPEPITSSKFFINTSSHEGMAIAVTEAMQLGLIPIVTPVGEVANYCMDNENSIYYTDESSTAKRIIKLLSNEHHQKTLSRNAVQYWSNKNSYSQDFIASCQGILRSIKLN
ncbi:glycosyltransferase [Psychrobacter sp. 219-2-C]|uniref:glycosyltransferase n=1 Tax=Psychrobacter sp. 219-2-C TaxID=3414707 RepID=UPI003C6E1C8D